MGFMAFMAFHDAGGCLRCIAVLKNGLGLLTSKKHVMWCRTCVSNGFPLGILEMARFPLPSGELTKQLKMAIYSEFSHSKW